jgi:hypothetical protein
LLVHLQHSLCQECQKVVQHIRFLLFGDEVASHVFGQAGFCLDQGMGDACVFPFCLLSGEVQRAGFARGSSRAPSTPGGLGYLVAKRLMDLNRVCSSCFLGFVLRGLFFLYRSPVICEQMQA